MENFYRTIILVVEEMVAKEFALKKMIQHPLFLLIELFKNRII
jgi:hypothetical protein